MERQGLLIVIEGSDGSGKTTQFNLLAERLKAAGYDVECFDFPRYDQSSSYFVKQYLNGRYGPADKLNPYTASLFYALDRYEAAKDIRAALADGKIVLANRYVGSNMAHQGGKFADPVEQRGFFVWEDNLEYQLLDIPRPDINFFLRVPADITQKLIEERAARSGAELDGHERDRNFLKKSLATYDLLCRLFPKDFLAIECTKGGQMLSVAAINNLLWAKIKPRLPADKPHPGHNTVVTLSTGSVRPAAAAGNDNGKLVHQFKSASLFLKLNIERQVKSVEPQGFGLWSDSGYRYYTPSGLPKAVETSYKQTMRRLAQLHDQMRRHLQTYYERRLLSGAAAPPDIGDLLRPAAPLAALCDFKASLSAKATQRLAARLLANDSQELQWTAKQLYTAAKHQWPDSFSRPLESDGNPEPINNIIAKLADDKLSFNSGDKNSLKLAEAVPRQEFSLLAESIFPYSSLSLEEIAEEVSGWSYRQKYESLKQASADPAVIGKVRYKFDVVSDQLVMAELTGQTKMSDVQTQLPSPRFGYEVPPAAEEAGIDELFMACFDESLKLFSILQRADRDDATVYATLLGHKLRWQFSADAGRLRPLAAIPDTSRAAPINQAIFEAVSEVHPLIWEALSGTGIPSAAPKKNRVKPAKRRPARRRRSKDK